MTCCQGSDPIPSTMLRPQNLGSSDTVRKATDPNSTMMACRPIVTTRIVQKIGLRNMPEKTLTVVVMVVVVGWLVVRGGGGDYCHRGRIGVGG